MEENRQQIRAVLTPEQQERFDEMKGRFEKRMKERRGARGEFRG
jgi:Spy/CpxP family protein refolding chaperone